MYTSEQKRQHTSYEKLYTLKYTRTKAKTAVYFVSYNKFVIPESDQQVFMLLACDHPWLYKMSYLLCRS